MTYYILLEGDSKQSIWDENILGEESFGTFYTKPIIFSRRVRKINFKMENNT